MTHPAGFFGWPECGKKWVSGVQNFLGGLTRKRPDAKMLENRRKSPKTERKRWSSWIHTVENPIFIQTKKLASAASFDRPGLVPPDWDCPQ